LHLWLLPLFGDSKGNPYIAKFGDTREGHPTRPAFAATGHRSTLSESPKSA
jgi:hypothetical protein